MLARLPIRQSGFASAPTRGAGEIGSRPGPGAGSGRVPALPLRQRDTPATGSSLDSAGPVAGKSGIWLRWFRLVQNTLLPCFPAPLWAFFGVWTGAGCGSQRGVNQTGIAWFWPRGHARQKPEFGPRNFRTFSNIVGHSNTVPFSGGAAFRARGKINPPPGPGAHPISPAPGARAEGNPF